MTSETVTCLQSILRACFLRVGEGRGLKATSVMSSLVSRTSLTREHVSTLREDIISYITRELHYFQRIQV